MEPTPLLKKVASILEKLDIPYIVTGGVAITLWGKPRFTEDIDIVIELAPQKIENLVKQFKKIKSGFIDEDMVKWAFTHEDEFNFIHVDSGLKVDFWILKDTAFDRERMNRRILKTTGSQGIYFASPEDVILKKLLWYQKSKSTRHLEDIESIVRIQKKLDYDYLKQWAKRHGTFKTLSSLIKF